MDNSNNQNDIVLQVPDITCNHCKSSIEGALSPLAGIKNVTVDIKGKTVHVVFEFPITLEIIKSSIADQGYTVSGLLHD